MNSTRCSSTPPMHIIPTSTLGVNTVHPRCGVAGVFKKRLGVFLLLLAQRSLHGSQACFPATAHTGQFSLLCCQPEALFVSVATRTPPFTERHPCGVRARSGHAVSAPHQDIHQITEIHLPSPRLGDRRTPTLPADYVGY